jgi:hypothetical protein
MELLTPYKALGIMPILRGIFLIIRGRVQEKYVRILDADLNDVALLGHRLLAEGRK